jgi:uroporphyrin-3 C-methyltransferase
VAVVLAVLAVFAAATMWQRLDRVQEELARRSAEASDHADRARELAERTDAQTQELQARLSVAEIKLSEVSLQRTQLEELMLSVSRSRDDTLVLDIESGVRLAMQQTELTGSVQPLVSALLAADQRISRAAQPRLNPVQRAMGRDIERIKASAVADLPALAAQLDELARLVDDLPLVNAAPAARGPAKAQSATPAPSRHGTESEANPTPNPASSEPNNVLDVPVPPAHGEPQVAAAWAGLQAQWNRYWNLVVERVTQSTRDLVRVSRIDQPEAVLLSPQQSQYLRENLRLKLLNARLGLLSRQLPGARADMQAVRAALLKYFDPQHPATRRAAQTLGDALQTTRSVEMPRPDETLAALAAAAKGR